MKRRAIQLGVTDHAVLRYLERQHGLNVAAVRRHLADIAQPAAELGAVAVQIERVKLILIERAGEARIVTVLPRAARAPHRSGGRS